MPEEVIRIVHDFKLIDFAHCPLTMLGAPLLIAFVEKWHKETSSFYLLFREKNINMDDVSLLFHLPIADRFWTTPIISMSIACLTAARDLGVSQDVVLKAFDFNKGSHLWMFWLQDRYEELVEAHMY